jgi:hypothetical protein
MACVSATATRMTRWRAHCYLHHEALNVRLRPISSSKSKFQSKSWRKNEAYPTRSKFVCRWVPCSRLICSRSTRQHSKPGIPDTEERNGETVRRWTKSQSPMAQTAKGQGLASRVRGPYWGTHGDLRRRAIRYALGRHGQAVGARCRRPGAIHEVDRALRRETH